MNQGVLGLALAVADVESTNEAIMNADANIDGSLIVNADYVGKLNQSVSGSSVSEGEDGEFGMGGKVEVAYCLEKDVILSAEEKDLYQWVCDQIFLVYGKQQVVDALNLISKVRKG